MLYNNDVFGNGLANNNAFGDHALFANIDGARNSAFGDSALSSNIVANANTAIGDGALASNDFFGAGNAVHRPQHGSWLSGAPL